MTKKITCDYCGNDIKVGEKVYYDNYYGGTPYCSEECVVEGFFYHMTSYRVETHGAEFCEDTQNTVALNEDGYTYRIELTKKYFEKAGETTLYIYRKKDGIEETYVEESLSSDLENMKYDTLSAFFYFWGEDFDAKDVYGRVVSPFSHEVLDISPEQIDTSNDLGKEFKELLIKYQEEYKNYLEEC